MASFYGFSKITIFAYALSGILLLYYFTSPAARKSDQASIRVGVAMPLAALLEYAECAKKASHAFEKQTA